MKTRLLPWLALAALTHTAWSAEVLPDYVRFAEDKRSARLEIAIRTLTLPSGQTVDLIGVVHIADGAYYQELNQRFASYDSVLFELVGDPEALRDYTSQAAGQQDRPANGISAIQQAAGRYLALSYQLGAIDYTAKNMVHADTTAEEFATLQQQRGENMLTLFASAMQAQVDGKMPAARELDTFALIRILMSPDSAAEFKKSLAKVFDQMEAVTAAMEANGASAILSGRNDVVVKKAREVLRDRKQRRIAVFFGAAHMPGIETSLVSEMNATVTGESWLHAWTMPRKKPAAASQAQSAGGNSTRVAPAGQ
jgi:hypothetical protein